MISLPISVMSPALASAQDSTVYRFEAGANLTAIRNTNVSGTVGPGVEGDINFGRHFAIDGSFNWLPSSFSQTVNSFIGVKAGIRREHFGFFGKARPGFFSAANEFRGSSFNVDTGQATARFGRLTERALDVGGVMEYYPSQHWLMRWDVGDTLVFEEPSRFIVIGMNAPPNVSVIGGTTNHLQFSTALHYRF
jgi:hypothetical protein